MATLKIPLERKNKRTDRMEKARLWTIADRTVRTWLAEAVADGVTFSIPITPYMFRHSYAMPSVQFQMPEADAAGLLKSLNL